MAEAWSVYIVPKRPWPDLRRAALALLNGWGDEEARLGVAPFDAEHLAFQVEHHDGRYRTVAGWDQSGLVLHRALQGRVVELHGSSNTDSVWIAAYDDGRVVDTHDTIKSNAHRVKRFRIDMGAAVSYGGFGVSPSMLIEHWTLPLHGPPPDEAHAIRFDVLLAQHTGATEAAAKRVEQGVADGQLDPVEGSDLLAVLGQTERALSVLAGARRDTQEQRAGVARRTLRLGRPADIESWATDADALPMKLRMDLLEALGRMDEARRIALEDDRQHADAYLAGARRSNPFLPIRVPPPDPARPLRQLAFRAAKAEAGLQRLEPVPEGLLGELDASGAPALMAFAKELRTLARQLAVDPVPHLRRLLQHKVDPTKLRPFYGHLALALDAQDAPDARDSLVRAHAEYIYEPELRAKVAAALERRGGPPEPEEDDAPSQSGAGLPSPTEEARAVFMALQEEIGASQRPEAAARLALARFEAGFEDAGTWLEDAYIALSHSSPYRGALERALAALGLF